MPLVDAERDVLGEIVDRKLVTELPLNGRDFGKLVALVPGATVEPSGVAAIQSGFGQFTINGNRDRSNNYTLDGTDNNDPFFNNSAFNQAGIGGAPASLLPIDAIQEFNLQSQFAAEYGRNSGSVVNIITRSGTNQIHGSASNSSATTRWTRATISTALSIPTPATRPQESHSATTISGLLSEVPIIEDKTFFFGAYEGQRESVTSDFSARRPHAAADHECSSSGARQRGDTQSRTDIDPRFLSNLLHRAHLPGHVADKNDVDSFIAKLDHQVNRFPFALGTLRVRTQRAGFSAGWPGLRRRLAHSPPFAQVSPTRVQLVSVSLLSTLGPTKINEIRFGYSRYRTSFSSRDASFDPGTLGIDFGTGKLSLPEIDFGGVFENLGVSAFSIPRGRTSQSFQILDNFTWVRGRHNIKLGGEFRRAAIKNFNDNLERGLITFSPDPSSLTLCADPTVPPCDDSGAVVLANYYIGSSFTLANSGNTNRNTFNNGLSFFVQDDIRVKSDFHAESRFAVGVLRPDQRGAQPALEPRARRPTRDGWHRRREWRLQTRPQQFRTAHRFCLERAPRHGRAGVLWRVLRLHSAGSADRKLHIVSGTCHESDRPTSGSAAELRFGCLQRNDVESRLHGAVSALSSGRRKPLHHAAQSCRRRTYRTGI